LHEDPFANNYNPRPSSPMSVTEEQKCDRFGAGSLGNSPSPKAAGLGIGPLTKLNDDAIAEEPSLEQINNTIDDDAKSSNFMCRICFDGE